MPTIKAYDYAVLRVVPKVEREEFINVGVILYCRQDRFLGVRVALCPRRLAALDASCDADLVAQELSIIERTAQGCGPMGALPLAERFRWLGAASSTVVQCSPIHQGLCTDPAAELEHIMNQLVLTSSDHGSTCRLSD